MSLFSIAETRNFRDFLTARHFGTRRNKICTRVRAARFIGIVFARWMVSLIFAVVHTDKMVSKSTAYGANEPIAEVVISISEIFESCFDVGMESLENSLAEFQLGSRLCEFAVVREEVFTESQTLTFHQNHSHVSFRCILASADLSSTSELFKDAFIYASVIALPSWTGFATTVATASATITASNSASGVLATATKNVPENSFLDFRVQRSRQFLFQEGVYWRLEGGFSCVVQPIKNCIL